MTIVLNSFLLYVLKYQKGHCQEYLIVDSTFVGNDITIVLVFRVFKELFLSK